MIVFVGLGIYQVFIGSRQCHKERVKAKKRAAGEQVSDSDESDDERKEIEEMLAERDQELHLGKVHPEAPEAEEEKNAEDKEADGPGEQADEEAKEERDADNSQTPLKGESLDKTDNAPDGENANKTFD